ncbi:MAG: hypothetical protein AVDCRST_MAG79-2870, partial [uncultured Thermoleophilia bacterium]
GRGGVRSTGRCPPRTTASCRLRHGGSTRGRSACAVAPPRRGRHDARRATREDARAL